MKSLLYLQLLLVSVASAGFRFQGTELGPIDPETEHLSKRSEPFNGWGTFDQLLDHAHPDLGTFKQRYWYGTEFWKGPGSPIIVTTPGEQSAEDFNTTYLGTKRLSGVFAKELGGAVIVLEHRYWGESSPFDTLSVKNLQHLTLNNSIKDLSYFAKNLVLPFDPSGGSSPAEAPWIFSGCSYAGGLASWSSVLDPGTYWAYHASSAVVQSIEDFWTYFVPVMEATPQNCSADLQAVITHVDETLLNGSPKVKADLKAKFKLEDLTDADFAGALEWGTWTWQKAQFHTIKSQGSSPYHQFCDYVENMYLREKNSYVRKVPGPEGVGLQKALDGYAQWMTNILLPSFCESYRYPEFQGSMNTLCLQQQNRSNPLFTDLAVNNTGNRQWNWMLCNQPFEWWQTGSPPDLPTLVSRYVNVDYWRSQCEYWFPLEADFNSSYTYSLARGKDATDVNAFTGGWLATNSTRIMHVNGELDPWRGATLSAIDRPGGPAKSQGGRVVKLLKGGTHCSDTYGQNWEVSEGARRLKDEEVAIMKMWVGQFYAERGKEWKGGF
ncbi:serine-type peptidase-like protein [Cercophora newfieldiana]|uniref:Serine-type peptidase-like protein n=1 Tax=Cercophora newfieldiana TaxID=92897 RepID=A0AA39Y0X7_9PEZI|nr:serine-type peptidase-like protein [Cercophora newfieldiana]